MARACFYRFLGRTHLRSGTVSGGEGCHFVRGRLLVRDRCGSLHVCERPIVRVRQRLGSVNQLFRFAAEQFQLESLYPRQSGGLGRGKGIYRFLEPLPCFVLGTHALVDHR